MMDTLIRFKGSTFNSESGELIHRDDSGNETTTRLQPQPGKLLLLLLECFPEVVSHEQIREVIWPEVQVDYEGSIHFCVRQVRAALNDKASDPVFVETIPRRGYRWMVELERSEGDGRTGVGKGKDQQKALLRRLTLVGVGIFTLVLVFLLSSSPFARKQVELVNGGKGEQPSDLSGNTNGKTPIVEHVRIGIMPFLPDASSHPFAENDIAFQLLEKLTNQYQDMFEVIGPTTTEGYTDSTMSDLATELELDCILNGRFVTGENEGRLLAEVIRASDGAHIWVKYYDHTDDQGLMVDEIVEAVEGRFVSP